MKVEFEIVHPDKGSSFRLLHQKATADKYLWQYHYHPEYELVCVLYGSGTRHVGNHLSTYENGDIVFIGPNLPHSGFGLKAHGIHEEIVVQIKEEVLQPALLNGPEMDSIRALLEKSNCGICFTGAAKEKARRRLIRLLKLPPFERLMELISVLQFLAVSSEYELLNPHVMFSVSMKKHRARLQSVFKYVEKHFSEETDIKKVAAIANLSVPSFCNYFKKIMNTTFTDFLNQYRIQHACLLLQEEKTIGEICFECGFNNITYFNKVFKNIIKKTPTEFKTEKKIIIT